MYGSSKTAPPDTYKLYDSNLLIKSELFVFKASHKKDAGQLIQRLAQFPPTIGIQALSRFARSFFPFHNNE